MMTGRRHRGKLRPERFTRSGHVLLSHNHIVLLEVLATFPGGHLPSMKEWLLAATVYPTHYPTGRSIWGFWRALRSLNGHWVRRRRVGGRVRATLLPRGWSILQGEVKAFIIQMGEYTAQQRFQLSVVNSSHPRRAGSLAVNLAARRIAIESSG